MGRLLIMMPITVTKPKNITVLGSDFKMTGIIIDIIINHEIKDADVFKVNLLMFKRLCN